MRRNIIKRITIIFALMSMLLLVCCGKKETAQIQQQNENNVDVAFEGKNLELEGIEGEILSYTRKNEKLYLLTESTTSSNAEGEPVYSYQFYSVDADGNTLQSISSQAGETVVAFCVDMNGDIVYIAEHGSEKEQEVELVKIDDKGTELSRKDFKQIVKNDSILLSGMVSDNMGQVVLACGENVYFLDNQLTSMGEIKAREGYVVDIALTKDGEIVCVTDQLNSTTVTTKVYLLNPEKRQWGDMLNIHVGENGESDYVIDGMEYDFYYIGSKGINGYDIATKESTEIINYDASYMTSLDAEGMVCMGSTDFVGKSENIIGDKTQITLVSYKKKDADSVSGKEIITFGTMYAGTDVKSAVAKFNRNSSDYEIVIEEYRYMDMDRLLSDIATGNGQDIMDLNVFPLSVAQCISKGLIEDLTPYYENDSEFHENVLVDAVREAMEVDGKMYYVTPSFSIKTMAAKTEDVGNSSGWTVSELKKLMNTKEKNVNLFSFEDTKESYLWNFIYYSVSDYIDWKNGTCNFDSEDFKYILELCNEKGMKEEKAGSDMDILEEVNSQYTRFQNGEYVLLEEENIDLNMIHFERMALGKNITYIGYPNKDKNGSMFQFNNKFAISSQSKMKTPAWEFIRTFLSKEYQKAIAYNDSMPIVKDMFDSKIKEMTAKEAYINEFGEMVEPIEEYSMTWGGIEVEMGTPTQEDVDIYMNLIDQTNRCADSDTVVFNIIVEEAADYFNGKKRLDKTAEIIQKRVTTYVNEQK